MGLGVFVLFGVLFKQCASFFLQPPSDLTRFLP